MNKQKLYIIIIFAIIPFSILCQSIIFRIDDYGIDNPYFYKDFSAIINKYSAKISIAAVPIKTNEQQWTSYEDSLFNFLSNLHYVEICQHGYNHKSYSYGTEFCGRDSIIQERDIKEGKHLLEKKSRKKILVFVPPFNSYDSNTLNIVNKLGFNVISGDVRNLLKVDFNGNKMKSVPFTVNLFDFIRLSRENKLKKDKIYIVLIHGYDFVENKSYYDNIKDQYNNYNSSNYAKTNLEEFSILLDLLNRKNVTYYHLNEISYNDSRFNYTNIAKTNRIYKLLPMPRIFELTNNGYLRLDNDIILNYGNIIIEILFYLIIVILSYIITHLLLNIKLFNVFISPLTIIITFLIIITINTKGWKDYAFGYRVYILFALWFGISIKIMVRYIKQKCKQ